MSPPSVSILVATLAAGKIFDAIEQVNPWLQTASYTSIQRYVRNTPLAYRGHVVSLLRDVLSGYPQTILAAPVLMRIDSFAHVVELPLPTYPPASTVRSVSWLPLSHLLADHPFSVLTQPAALTVSAGLLECAVLCLRLEHDDDTELVIQSEWWADLYRQLDDASCYISSRYTGTYCDALEVGLSLLKAARGLSLPAPDDLVFCSLGALEWAGEAGRSWAATLDDYPQI